MPLENIYYIGQTVAVLAILASLVFVGLQVRQNTKATRAASAYEVYKAWGLFASDLFHEDDQVVLSTTRLFDKNVTLADFSEVELARGHLFMRSIIQRDMANWLLCKEGSLPREYWEPHRKWLRNAINLPVIGKIFEMERAQGIFTQDFYDELMKEEESDLDFSTLSHPGGAPTGKADA